MKLSEMLIEQEEQTAVFKPVDLKSMSLNDIKKRLGFSDDKDWNDILDVGVHRTNIDIMKVALENGADANKLNSLGNTALYQICITLISANPSYGDKYEKIIKLLLKYGANPDIPNQHSVVPLMVLAYEDHLEETKILVRHGADVNAKDRDGRTVLDHAYHESQTHKWLKSKGAKPGKKSGKFALKESVDAEPWDVCPVCQEKMSMRCKCHIGDRYCKNKHHWTYCSEHKKHIILGDLDTHKGVYYRNKCQCQLEGLK